MSDKDKGFINSDSLTKWVKWLLLMQIVMAMVSLASGTMEYRLLSDYENGVYISQEQAVADGAANDARQGIIALIYLVVMVISGIAILKWIYRANCNARQLGARDMEFTPGWSIGWYFVPIAMLWKPYQAMKEIWKASINPENWNEVKVSSVLPWWWFFWLANNFLGQAVMRTSLSAEEIAELKTANILYQMSDVTGIILALVTLSLVNSIYSAQTTLARGQS